MACHGYDVTNGLHGVMTNRYVIANPGRSQCNLDTQSRLICFQNGSEVRLGNPELEGLFRVSQ